ncbi:MAG: hypothetical protein IT354_08830 [Gemmatimonadaceae bacterium]|jgi:hypothetical protein|nr:hypothetical protein [Gemmatimonadaceae bacterium]
MRRLFRSTAIAGMLSALIGCRDTTAPDRDLADAALINLAISSMSVISVTEIPKAGRPFEVRVQSYGLDGCWVLDRSVVVSDESGATITPYNRRDAAPTGACTDAIVAIPHRVMLTFTSAGPKTIAVRARDFETRAPVTFQVTVTVAP